MTTDLAQSVAIFLVVAVPAAYWLLRFNYRTWLEPVMDPERAKERDARKEKR